MARDSINRNGIESPPVELIVDSKYSIYLTLLYVCQSLPLSLFPSFPHNATILNEL